jgi:hypothetical protein
VKKQAASDRGGGEIGHEPERESQRSEEVGDIMLALEEMALRKDRFADTG